MKESRAISHEKRRSTPRTGSQLTYAELHFRMAPERKKEARVKLMEQANEDFELPYKNKYGRQGEVTFRHIVLKTLLQEKGARWEGMLDRMIHCATVGSMQAAKKGGVGKEDSEKELLQKKESGEIQKNGGDPVQGGENTSFFWPKARCRIRRGRHDVKPSGEKKDGKTK